MADQTQLNPWTGEFADRSRERSYRKQMAAELARHAWFVFVLSAVVNILFLASNWYFVDLERGAVALAGRVLIILAAVSAAGLVWRGREHRALDRILIALQWATSVGAALLLRSGSGSDRGMFLVVLLPALYYLMVPLPFVWAVAGGLGASLLLLASYVGLSVLSSTLFSFSLALLCLNWALALALVRANRQQRMHWSAMEAERAARNVLLQSQHLLEHTFMAMPIPVLITEIGTGRIVRFNEAGVRYFGGAPDAFDIRSVVQIYADPLNRRTFLDQLAREGRVTNFETKIRLGHGEIRTVLLAAAFTEVDGCPCVVSAVVDISARLQAEHKLRYAATHDALTGLMNRSAFLSHLEEAIRSAPDVPGAVILLLLDLDALKELNDTLGHDAGDALLVETARRLEMLAGDLGTVARLGGDEFIILLRDPPSPHAATELASAILRAFRRPTPYGERSVSGTASIGIAMSVSRDHVPGELMKDADLALYAAKQQGRGRSVVYTPSMRRTMNERLTLKREMKLAVASDAIRPYYQPKISRATGRLAGMEALMRWCVSPREVRLPGSFAMAFEDADLATLTGEVMLRRISRDARAWMDSGLEFGRIAFNLAPAQFADRRLATRILTILAEEGIEPRMLDVEVTENVFLGLASETVALVLDELYAAGMRIALDDFGTGYAALTHLKQLPIDAMKIDRSFVSDLQHDPYDAAIVCAVIELGRNLGLRVIAEGVESLGHAQFLRARGCEYAQGFFFGAPMAADDMAAFLAAEGPDRVASRLKELQAFGADNAPLPIL